MFSNSPCTTRRVLLVKAGECSSPVPEEVLAAPDAEWLILEPVAAVDFLRSEPFAVTAVIVSASGERRDTHELIASLKAVSSRVPVVFLDENPSPDSEVRIRRTGVHYYAHIPVCPGEISAVLEGLSACGLRNAHIAVRSAS